jgi:hypothetical protein
VFSLRISIAKVKRAARGGFGSAPRFAESPYLLAL